MPRKKRSDTMSNNITTAVIIPFIYVYADITESHIFFNNITIITAASITTTKAISLTL